MNYTVARDIASCVEAMYNCRRSGNEEWVRKHAFRITKLCHEYMPSGSGFDSGTELDFGKSHGDKLVFVTSFHHMTEHGYYDGWTEHTVTVRPAFSGLSLVVGGRDRNDIKDYIAETFHHALLRELTDEERKASCE